MSRQDKGQTILGYWLGYVGEGNTLNQIPQSVDIVALAFAVTAPENTITTDFLTKAHSEKEIRDGAAFLQKRGQKVVMSINGRKDWPGHPGGWGNLDPKAFADNVKKIVIDDWGLDGIDLDCEAPEYTPPDKPDGNFVQVIKALRNALGPDKTICLPVFFGTDRDAYLIYVKYDIDYIFTMAYWNHYDDQISMLTKYQGLVGNEKVGIGVAEAAWLGQNTNFKIVPKLARYKPKAGMMLWTLNSTDAAKWTKAIVDNLPS